MTTTTAQAPTTKRRWRNFLLDAPFQLRLTAYIVGVSLVMAALLGIFLVRAANSLLHETSTAVDARSAAAEVSRELSGATLSNELMAHMNDPAFEKQFREQAQAIDAKYDAERAAIVTQRAELERHQQLTWWVLGGCLVSFIAVVALATIVVTHRMVGPLFRIKRMMREVAEGHLNPPQHGLREGDELQDVFEVARDMTQRLRAQQTEDARALSEALAQAKTSGATGAWVDELTALETRYRERLAR
ncbi:HAMP domain-containing protein [Corallococcus sp. AB004]|uniref:HAMP domain-containing protein n=1 Tax=Corallococcus TaxID=83461 RepID=UPI000EA33CA2|nr:MULTISPECIES: HAMP domain-containing protein [Corallococcus]RKI42212.1 HAMP domain-containing protein [Corallococcus sp. AB004]NPC71591.1 HAMP domain-containing protein [Corallococcus exiguus]NPD26087.1 HAMP domain-containing protein [Corallococcus exiguus]NRD46422.1 HAMP domain-containing protein [Corallococcus exiguus]RKH98734.1 HAMP domain-containing protein [Corallococcus sp. AB038B]